MIELHATRNELRKAEEVVSDLHGLEVDPDATTGRRRPEVAGITRDLLALADRLDLAASMVRQEYWAVKGYDRAVEA